jgi:fermentation-respiration switch protein FrsA (DUF1100 family)
LFQTAKNPADEIWEVPGALHSEGYKTDPAQYVQKVNAFFSNAFANP